MIPSDNKCLNYKTDPKLSVKINESVLLGDRDVSESSTYAMRPLHPGPYKCISVHPGEGCAPITIYYHESLDPMKVMEQGVLMSKDILEHNDIPDQN